jgi:hypothetical protein
MKEYLGDSVYAEVDNIGNLVLTTENGLLTDPSNTIVLEPDITGNLIKFIAQEVKRGKC